MGKPTPGDYTKKIPDLTIFWRGIDVNGRELELQCSLVTEGGNDTIVIKDAHSVRVGTAYDADSSPEDEKKLKKKWLEENPDYEETLDKKGIQRRMKIEKV